MKPLDIERIMDRFEQTSKKYKGDSLKLLAFYREVNKMLISGVMTAQQIIEYIKDNSK